MQINHLLDLHTYVKNVDKKEESTLSIGQKIQGKVLNQIKNLLFLELKNGEILKAKTPSHDTYDTNKMYEFQIKHMSHKQIVMLPIKSIDKEESINHLDGKIKDLLIKLGIEPSKEKQGIIKQLIQNQIPVTKERVQDILQWKRSFNSIEKLLQNVHFNKNSSNFTKDVTKVVQNFLKDEGNSELKQDLKGEFKNIDSKDYTTSFEKQARFQGKRNIDFLKSLDLTNVSFEKIIFLLKNRYSMNLMNMSSINQILFKGFTMSKQIDELVDILLQDPKTSLLGEDLEKTLEKFTNKILKKELAPEKVFQTMDTKFKIIQSSIENMSIFKKEDILLQVSQLKGQIDFMSKLNEFQTYVQIPLILNGEKKDLELLIKKEETKKHKIDPENTNILVALETKTMDRVQIVIQMKKNHIRCHFKITDEKIRETLESHESNLKRGLFCIGLEEVDIMYSVLEARPIFDEMNEFNNDKVGNVDIRV